MAGAHSWQPDRIGNCPPRVIAVTSGKKNVGKSCIVVNLGVALSQMGKKVLILDADLNLANIHSLLGLNPQYTISDVLNGQKSLADVMVSGPCGLQIVPAAPGRGEFSELTQAQRLFLLEELDAFAEQFDFLLLDTGAGISTNVLYFNVGAQERIVVADQEPASVIEAYTLIKALATRYAEKRFKLLFNKISRPRQAQLAHDQLIKVADRFLHGSVSIEYLGFIPCDEAMVQSVNVNKVLMEIAPSSPAYLAITEIARALIVQDTYTAMDGNIKFFWQSLNRRAADTIGKGESHASRLR
jgi:flagellar biosynthesis protein FlhG